MYNNFNNNSNKMAMSDNTIISIIMFVALPLSILFIISITGFLITTTINNRDVEFHEKIYIDIPQSESKLIIEEYDLIFRSGAYISTVDKYKNNTLIGNIETKYGFRPFDRNQYRVEFKDGGVNIEWAEVNDANVWKSKFFKFALIRGKE